jgi:hypothetical protein
MRSDPVVRGDPDVVAGLHAGRRGRLTDPEPVRAGRGRI